MNCGRAAVGESPLREGLRLGLIYFAVVFGAGFALGVLRVLVVVPRLGETRAVLLELPVILTLAWFLSRRLIRRLAGGLATRAAMAACAMLLVLAVEYGLALLAPGARPVELMRHWTSLPGLLGLAGQVFFALMPLIGGTRPVR